MTLNVLTGETYFNRGEFPLRIRYDFSIMPEEQAEALGDKFHIGLYIGDIRVLPKEERENALYQVFTVEKCPEGAISPERR